MLAAMQCRPGGRFAGIPELAGPRTAAPAGTHSTWQPGGNAIPKLVPHQRLASRSKDCQRVILAANTPTDAAQVQWLNRNSRLVRTAQNTSSRASRRAAGVVPASLS